MSDPEEEASEPGQIEPGTGEMGDGPYGTPVEASVAPFVEQFTMTALPVEYFEMGG